MKYKPGHKQASRRRIVEAASRQFRERGVRGTSLPGVMRDAGMTVGGFYRHFESKEELFREALHGALVRSLERLAKGPEELRGREWIEKAAAVYLNSQHRTNLAGGCALPMLTPEVARGDEQGRRVFSEDLERMVDTMAACMGEAEEPATRAEAWALLSLMVGNLLLSRGVAEDDLAEEILQAGREASVRMSSEGRGED